MSVTVGSKGRAACVVNDQNTAAAVGSGLLPVFATPQMIALMENAAVDASQLDEIERCVRDLRAIAGPDRPRSDAEAAGSKRARRRTGTTGSF